MSDTDKDKIIALLRAEVKAWRAIDRPGNTLLTNIEEMQAIVEARAATDAAGALEDKP